MSVCIESHPRTDNDVNPLAVYLREIDSTPLLSPNEERDLGRRIAEGDREARDQMVRANLRLVVKISREYVGKGLPLQDLISEGNLGLVRATEGYDPEMNTRFSTYASYWIHQSITRALANSAKTIRIPAYVVQLVSRWRRAASRLEDQLGRPATPEEIARYLEINPKKIDIVRQALAATAGVGAGDGSDDSSAYEQSLPDFRVTSPEEQIATVEENSHIASLLNKLDERSGMVLRLRYGFQDGDPKTLDQISQVLGLTRERVRQIERKAIAWLQTQMSPAEGLPQPKRKRSAESRNASRGQRATHEQVCQEVLAAFGVEA